MTDGTSDAVSQAGRAFLRIHPLAGALGIMAAVAVTAFSLGGLVALWLMRDLPARVEDVGARVGALEDWRDGQMGEIIRNFSELRCIMRAERLGLDVDEECPQPDRVIPPRTVPVPRPAPPPEPR